MIWKKGGRICYTDKPTSPKLLEDGWTTLDHDWLVDRARYLIKTRHIIPRVIKRINSRLVRTDLLPVDLRQISDWLGVPLDEFLDPRLRPRELGMPVFVVQEGNEICVVRAPNKLQAAELLIRRFADLSVAKIKTLPDKKGAWRVDGGKMRKLPLREVRVRSRPRAGGSTSVERSQDSSPTGPEPGPL